jgi:hypothetical protein
MNYKKKKKELKAFQHILFMQCAGIHDRCLLFINCSRKIISKSHVYLVIFYEEFELGIFLSKLNSLKVKIAVIWVVIIAIDVCL